MCGPCVAVSQLTPHPSVECGGFVLASVDTAVNVPSGRYVVIGVQDPVSEALRSVVCV